MQKQRKHCSRDYDGNGPGVPQKAERQAQPQRHRTVTPVFQKGFHQLRGAFLPDNKEQKAPAYF